MFYFLRSHPELILALFSFVIFHFLIFRKRSPPNWPVIGMLPSLLLNVHRLHDWSIEVLNKNLTFMFIGPWFSNMDMLITCDPLNVRHVFCSNFANYPKGPEFSMIFDILGDGIFNSDSDSWKLQRKIAQYHISTQNFKFNVEKNCMEKVRNGLIPVIQSLAEKNAVVDFQDLMLRFTFDSTCHFVFGVDPQSLTVEFPVIRFSKALDDAEEALVFRHVIPERWWKLLKWLNLGEEKKLTEAWKAIDEFISERISDKRKENGRLREEEREEKGDLLSSYMNSLQEDEGKLNCDKFIRDTALNFMLAGRDTTGVAFSWFFYMISQNPLVETKILDELQMISENHIKSPKSTKNPNGFSHKYKIFSELELSDAVYLSASLYETLRLFPPVPLEHKGVLKSEILPSGHEIKPGMKLLFSSFAMGRMEEIWGKDCHEFKPERWITTKGKLRLEPSFKFTAFNSGPRTCLGRELALRQMKTVAASILYNFQIHQVEGHNVNPKISIILHMKNGMKVRFSERKKSGRDESLHG